MKMKTTNNQINAKTIELLKSLKGKTLRSITHEQFKFTPTSYGIVYLAIDDKTYVFRDYQKPMDYFKAREDISSIEFEEQEGELSSSVEGIPFVTEEISQTILRITLINTEQQAKNKETGETYLFLDTRSVVFLLENGYQLSLTKDDFCECISIYRGYEAFKEVDELKKRLDDFYGPDLLGTYSISCLEL